MVIKITDYCGMGCLHCMQNSTPNGKHMSFEVFKDSIAFAKECLVTGNAVLLSGGEPLQHPEFFKFLDYTLEQLGNMLVYVLTNGFLLNDPQTCEELRKRVDNNGALRVQVCSIPSLYPKHAECHAGYLKLKDVVAKRTLWERLVYTDSLPAGIVPIGRAKHSQNYSVTSQLTTDRKATSCFNGYSCLTNIGDGNIIHAIKYMKFNSKTSVCKPLVLENGDVVFGEYAECSVVTNVSNLPEDRVIDIRTIKGPCRKCVNSKEQRTSLDRYLPMFKERA